VDFCGRFKHVYASLRHICTHTSVDIKKTLGYIASDDVGGGEL